MAAECASNALMEVNATQMQAGDYAQARTLGERVQPCWGVPNERERTLLLLYLVRTAAYSNDTGSSVGLAFQLLVTAAACQRNPREAWLQSQAALGTYTRPVCQLLALDSIRCNTRCSG